MIHSTPERRRPGRRAFATATLVLASVVLAGAAHAQGLRLPGAGGAPGPGPAAAPEPPAGGARAVVVPRAEPGRVVLVDRIVAVVNKDVITRNELEERTRIVLRQLQQQNVQPPPVETLQRQVLERMIGDRAQLQFAQESGIRIDEPSLDQAIERIAQGNRMSVGDFRRALERDGIAWERLRGDVRTEMLMARLREREIDSKIQISESEIDNFIADEEANASEIQELNISHILVRVPDGATSAQVERLQARARDALGQLRAGTEFARVAVAFSDAPDGLQGGSLGWRTRDRVPELFAEAVENLKPGQTSEVLRSPAGFHIVRLVERRGIKSNAPPVEQTRVRHILIRTNELVSEAEGRRRILQLRDRIVQGAAFADIARLNSDDSSAARGGDIGWMFPGDTVPEFERAMNELAPNALSQPVRSPFGWHLIEVLERRTGDVGAERKRANARRALRERKAEEAYQDWSRQIRDRAYVELRLEER